MQFETSNYIPATGRPRRTDGGKFVYRSLAGKYIVDFDHLMAPVGYREERGHRRRPDDHPGVAAGARLLAV